MFQTETIIKMQVVAKRMMARAISFALFTSSTAQAAVPNAFRALPIQTQLQVSQLNGERGFNRNGELDLSYIQSLYQMARSERQTNLSQYVPMNMQASSDEGSVLTKVASHSLSNWLKSESVQQTSIAGWANKLENPVDTKLSLGSAQDGTRHDLRFSIDTASTVARLKYQGAVNAEVRYLVPERSFQAEVYKRINQDTRLVLNHSDANGESRDTLSVQISF